MDIKELRDKSGTELERMLAEGRNRLRELRFRLASKQLADVREVREMKKTIARILSLKNRAGKAKKAAKVATGAAKQG